MHERRICGRSQRLCRLLLAGSVLLGSRLVAPQPARADASGCTLYPNTTPALEAQCEGGGDGCYICEYHYTGQPGYTECSESPDGVAIVFCKDRIQPYNQVSPSTVASGPVTPTHAANGNVEEAPRGASKPK
jgi:hypothetical protein